MDKRFKNPDKSGNWIGVGNREVLKMPGAILMGLIALLAWLGI